jgi:pilus assembly protein CpaB
MRRGRVFFFLAFILILGLAGVLIVYRFLLPRTGPGPGETPTPTPRPIEILYVTQNVSKGTKLDTSMLAAIPWQENAIAPGMFTADQLSELEGRIVKFDIAAGTPLVDSFLLKENEQLPTSGSPWALTIPPGMVAVSIPVNRIANISYAPRPGDHINVIVNLAFVDIDTDFQSVLPNHTGLALASGPPNPETGAPDPLTVGVASLALGGGVNAETGEPQTPGRLEPGLAGKTIIDPVLGQALYVVPSERQRPRFVSHMLLQDVVVLQVGDFPLPGQEVQLGQATPTPGPEEVQQGEQAPAAVAPDVITLIVRPQDALTLNFIMMAQSKMAAQLSLVLRSANDNSRENVLPVTLQFLLEQYQIPVPARLPYSLNPRIDDLSLP